MKILKWIKVEFEYRVNLDKLFVPFSVEKTRDEGKNKKWDYHFYVMGILIFAWEVYE